jgi:hypothetical protein
VCALHVYWCPIPRSGASQRCVLYMCFGARPEIRCITQRCVLYMCIGAHPEIKCLTQQCVLYMSIGAHPIGLSWPLGFCQWTKHGWVVLATWLLSMLGPVPSYRLVMNPGALTGCGNANDVTCPRPQTELITIGFGS